MKSQRIKETMRKVFCLPPVPALLVAVPSFILVNYVLVNDIHIPFITDIIYVMASYALIVTVVWIVGILSRVRRKIIEMPFAKKIQENPLYERYIKEIFFRIKISLFKGSLVSLLYAGIKLFSGIYYHSFWLIILAFYYMLLVAMRASLIASEGKMEEAEIGQRQVLEWEKYRQCGIMLLFMNQILLGIVVYVVQQNKSFEYRGALIYVMALYSFYAVIISVRNMVMTRKYASPVMSAARVVNLTAAIVSMLSVQTAMMARFGGDDDAGFRQVLLSITGGAVCLIVLGMAVYMIVKAGRQLKKAGITKTNSKKGENYDK